MTNGMFNVDEHSWWVFYLYCEHNCRFNCPTYDVYCFLNRYVNFLLSLTGDEAVSSSKVKC